MVDSFNMEPGKLYTPRVVDDPNSSTGKRIEMVECPQGGVVSIAPSMGCVCPPGSEATCQGLACPRRTPRFA